MILNSRMAYRLVSNNLLKYGMRNVLESNQRYMYNRNVNILLIVGLKTGRITFNQTEQKQDENVKKETTGKELDVARKNPYADLTTGEKVKAFSKDFTYLTISVVAVGILAVMVISIGRELFSSDSVVGVYSKALKRCAQDSEIIVALGQPIKGYGEESGRRRRRHINHIEFMSEGRKHMRMKFHLEGSDKKGEVNLEVVQGDDGKYSYRYLFVQLEHFPYTTIVLEDNR